MICSADCLRKNDQMKIKTHATRRLAACLIAVAALARHRPTTQSNNDCGGGCGKLLYRSRHARNSVKSFSHQSSMSTRHRQKTIQPDNALLAST